MRRASVFTKKPSSGSVSSRYAMRERNADGEVALPASPMQGCGEGGQEHDEARRTQLESQPTNSHAQSFAEDELDMCSLRALDDGTRTIRR